MQMAPYVQALQDDLARAAALSGDESAQEAGRRLAQALEPALQLRLLDLLGEIALSLNSQVPGPRGRNGSRGRAPARARSRS